LENNLGEMMIEDELDDSETQEENAVDVVGC